MSYEDSKADEDYLWMVLPVWLISKGSTQLRSLENLFPKTWGPHVDGCQNYGLFLVPYYNTAPNI